MKKIIHYCWFGGKPLPKLAKNCIRSWKKYLPDYEIMRWDETNFDVNMTEFSKKAYENKKWAFVSDVARAYALKKEGGIYFDTDMLVTKKIDFLLDNDFFVGWESKDYVAVGVMGAKKPNNPIVNKLFEIYQNLVFDENKMYTFAIPVILTKLLKEEYDLKNEYLTNQKLKGNTWIYARDYFYPLSYNYQENMFTDNTCMIHYYDASWASKGEQKTIKIYRILGKKKGELFIKVGRRIKPIIRTTTKVILFPLVYIRRKLRDRREFYNKKNDLINNLNKIKDNNYLVIYNPLWLGTTYATKELFDNSLPIGELHSRKYENLIIQEIVKRKFKLVIFSAFSVSWATLARTLKKVDDKIDIKIIWHGSNSMHIEDYDWDCFSEMMSLYKEKIIKSLTFVKKSMADFYEAKGYKVEFLMNNLHIDPTKVKPISREGFGGLKIGIYASGDRWVKNFYNQLCAASMFKDAVVDCVPTSKKLYDFASLIDLNISGSPESLPREELFSRLATNDLNIYVTFTECAPLLPLESFELGVPCITGNNHHYWENTELRDYVIVDEADNVMAIYNKAKYCYENKEKVMKLYREWKASYDKEAAKNIEQFLKIEK